MKLQWSKLRWWMKAGFLSLLAYGCSLVVTGSLCGSQGWVCNLFAGVSRFVNTPVNLIMNPVLDAVARLMGFSSAHIVFESEYLERQSDFLLLLSLPALLAYWFGIGVIAGWAARRLKALRGVRFLTP